MKYEDEKIEKLQWHMIHEFEHADLGRVDFDSETESKKDIEFDPNDGNIADVFIENFF